MTVNQRKTSRVHGLLTVDTATVNGRALGGQ